MRSVRLTCLLTLLALTTLARDAVTIRVDAAETLGPFKPGFAYFGYDEPNYTYTKNGRKLLAELASLSETPVQVRTHFLLATGDGTAALKWGSTNAYTEDASGKPVYDWTIVDRILDTYVQTGIRPFMEIGFMPEALSVKPQPYRPVWFPGSSFNDYFTGWTRPPKDYAKWAELIGRLVSHCAERYGRAAAESWFWEVWNEPDIAYWRGTPEEYDKLYDYTAAALKRVLPSARIGGPASTGPSNTRAASFLRQFLEHCSEGKNSSTGSIGAPLDFISYHAKGRPSIENGRARMGIANQARDVQAGMGIVASFPKYRGLPIILSESDPEGCAACSARVYPRNGYRNGPLYPAYTAVMLNVILQLAAQSKTNIEGVLTWAFEFEDQPWFDGFRTLATNGVDKAVLNFFRMAGMMHGDRVAVQSTGAVSLREIISAGVRNGSDVNALAVRSGRGVSVLAWNYHDDGESAPDAEVHLNIEGLPDEVHRVLMRHYRVDQDHSNAWAVWKRLGSPQSPGPEQYWELEAAGQLAELGSPVWMSVDHGVAGLSFELPQPALSLVQLTW